MTMTLERALDVLRVVTSRAMQGSETRDAYDCVVSHLTQPAQWVDVIPEGCIAVPRSLVERWANVDAFNAPVGAAMELRVIAGEMLMHAAALQEKGNG